MHDPTTTDVATVRVLLAEDDDLTRMALGEGLKLDGFEVHEAPSGSAALELVDQVDLVVLDVGLPGLNGLDVLTRIRRERDDVPIIMVTARSEEPDRVLGLELGADDYVPKPVTPRELSARIRAVLRRTRASQHATTRNGRNGHHQDREPTLEFGELHIDPAAREVRVRGDLIELTTKEFDLLLRLARSPRVVLSREQLLNDVWDSRSDWQDPATVTEHVRRLRIKLDTDPREPRWIHTIRGVGYRFEP